MPHHKPEIAFLGLGVMGAPMAGHLSKNYALTVYNRTASKAEHWAEHHTGNVAKTPAEAAHGKDIVISCVGDDADVRAIATGPDGAFQAMKPGAIFIDHTTTSANLARELDTQAKKQSLRFMDAPVSGGQAGAEKGTLTIMCGGEKSVFDQSTPILQSYGKAITYIGSAGAGQTAKMANQICIAGILQSLSEAIRFIEKTGLDVETVIEAISQGAAGSWQMSNRASTMHNREFDFGFAIDWFRKDLGHALTEARAQGASLPITALIDQFYAELQMTGDNRQDTSALIKRLI